MRLFPAMNQLVFFLLFGLLGGPAVAVQEPVLDTGAYVVSEKKSGKQLWRASWEFRREWGEMVLVEKGQGLYGRAEEPVAWEVKSRTVAEDPGQFLKSDRIFTDPASKQVKRTIERRYHELEQTLEVSITGVDSSAPARVKIWRVEGDLVVPETMGSVFRHQLGQGQESFPMTLVTAEPARYKATATVLGQETVTVPAGTYECVKVELVLHLGHLGLLGKVFVPKTYMWHTAQPPHHWVRYEGLESGLGSPHVVAERLSPVP
jgi:hypothetical protein